MNTRTDKLLLALLFLPLAFGLCYFPLFTAAASYEVEEETIIILYTQDEHGTFENSGRLAYKIEAIRKQYENVFLFTAGDIFTGNPYTDRFTPPGQPMVDLLNTHLGDNDDRRLAAMTDRMHLLIGGHSHDPLIGESINNTLYTRGGSAQTNLGKV